MADTRADMLISFVDYLNSIDRELSSMLTANRRHLARTDARVSDTFAQLASSDERDEPRPVWENGSSWPGESANAYRHRSRPRA